MERYRIYPEAAVYFVTYTVVEWLPIFVSRLTCEIVTKSLNYCSKQKNLGVNAFVIMPTHLHAILFDKAYNNNRLEKTLADFRKFTGRNLSDWCSKKGPKCFADTIKEAATADRNRRFWQPSRHPEAIMTEKFWNQKLDYLHDNPCRKGLVAQPDHWSYSSARFYMSDGREACGVDISAISWG